jgi:hypothetical protein
MSWLFVDDSPDEARAFADELTRGKNALEIEVSTPADARSRLLKQGYRPSGVLMDVDFSAAAGELGSGPGLAQDIRVKQKAGDIAEYPIVRFALRARVARNVKGDPGSDDLFDLRIQKEEVTQDRASVQERVIGLGEVYRTLDGYDPTLEAAAKSLLGLSDAELDRWCHQGFRGRISSGRQIATHVAASAFLRDFLLPTGLLIDEDVLSWRLGVERASSPGWSRLRDELSFRYRGVAGESFRRWWARGLEDWWVSVDKEGRALAGLPIPQRIEALRKASGGDLTQLVMPRGSAGDRPWRPCAINLEADPPRSVPVDPAEAVRLVPRSDIPPWSDPLCVALGTALQEKHDLRLNRSDLARLEHKHR